MGSRKFIPNVVVYLHALSATPTGPFAWCAHIVTVDGVEELSDYSDTVHFTRLMIEGGIVTLRHIEPGSNVSFINSDRNLKDYVFDRLGNGSDYKSLQKNKVKNLDLFPHLFKAKSRHQAVVVKTVSKADMNEEHSETAGRAKEIVREGPRQARHRIIEVHQSPTAEVNPPW